MTLDKFMFVKAGTHNDGTEQKQRGRACPAGRVIPRRLLITHNMANKLKEGEREHCEDHRLAFALGEGKYNQAIKDLASADYCPGGPQTTAPDCNGEFNARFKDSDRR